MPQFVNVVWSGLWLGSAYGFLAIALVASFRAARIINLSVGGAFVFAAMFAQHLQVRGYSAWAAAACGVAAALVIAAGQERLILRPIVGAAPSTLLLGTLAVGIILAGMSAVLFGRDPITGDGLAGSSQVRVSVWHSNLDAIALVLAAAAMSVVAWVVLEKSRLGRAVGAAGFDSGAARMLGINVWRLRMVAMAVAGIATGIGGVLFLPLGVLDSSQGLSFTLYGFVAAAVAGYANVRAALAAAWAFGLVSALGTSYVSSAFSQAVAFGTLVIVVLAGQSATLFARRA